MKVFGNHRPLIIDAAKRSGVASLWSEWDTKTYVFLCPPHPHNPARWVKLHWSSKYTRSRSWFSRQVRNQFITVGFLLCFPSLLLSLVAAGLSLSHTHTHIDGRKYCRFLLVSV